VRAVHTGQRYLSRKITETIVEDYLHQLDEVASPLDRLTDREREVLQLVAEGKTSADIAEVLSISIKTVETYRSRIMHKLDLRDLPALVKFAIQQGLIPLE
jgi:DNA-binding NarL/FixJ family response regulator